MHDPLPNELESQDSTFTQGAHLLATAVMIYKQVKPKYLDMRPIHIVIFLHGEVTAS